VKAVERAIGRTGGGEKGVDSNPLSKGGASNGHYNGNAETYTNVGLGMGEAMVKLLKNK
jgi:hypothetical protein